MNRECTNHLSVISVSSCSCPSLPQGTIGFEQERTEVTEKHKTISLLSPFPPVHVLHVHGVCMMSADLNRR